ncbi:signal peptidase I [Dethiobacter alkaliphilus]|uniref:Signal peptidase I n=1 Tax=Dethiobacter alkaliphilus AHT 1 TaxID=555088 RepID=C0GHM2_DETAL|nr:signal peptidase I [Dethiobacter alkaliphilus]EEG77228.1 signal peptidase I [Dethiobacter alkaliphilus AHT 1]
MLEAEKKEAWEWIKSILVAVVLALVIRAFLVEVFLVQGESMLPTLDDRERLIVSKVQYYYREPEIGEIIVFQASDHRDFIKRVIGGPGDEVRIDTDGVYVNGEKLDEPYVLEDARRPFQTVVVPDDALFVLGDNRNNSMDSRHPSVDFVSFDSLKGKAMFVFWPLDRIRLLSHP